MRNKTPLRVMLLVATVGVVDSFYLTVTHFANKTVECSLIEGCDVVLRSVYASIGPVPTALFGFFFYLVMFYILLLILSGKMNTDKLIIVQWLARIGFLASIFFLYVQAFILNAYCQYCLLSFFTGTTLFILSFYKPREIEISSNNE